MNLETGKSKRDGWVLVEMKWAEKIIERERDDWCSGSVRILGGGQGQ